MNHRMLKGVGSRNIKLEKRLKDKIDKNLHNIVRIVKPLKEI